MAIRITRSIIPNMLTLGNMFSGFSSIIYASEGNFNAAAIFIIAAALFDMFDGITARLINATSEIGAELDSLCDVVSFGIAPAFILYKTFFFQYGTIGILVASLPALMGAVRLARFNVTLDSFDDKVNFIGMPIPSSAITLVPYIVFVHNKGIINEPYQSIIVFVAALLTSISMVSTIQFPNAPRPHLMDFKNRPFVWLFFFSGIIVSIITMGKGIFFFMLFYIVISYSLAFYRLLFIRRSVEDEMDEEI